MDSRSQTASSNLNALETLKDILLLSEDFWAGSAVGHSSETLHRHCSVVAPTSCQGMHTTITHKHVHTSQHTDGRKHIHTHIDNTSPQPTHKRLSLQGIQSHREIWPYRPNWIVVILCLTSSGDVLVGLGDIMPSWALLLMQKVRERSELSFGPLPSGLMMEYHLRVRPQRKRGRETEMWSVFKSWLECRSLSSLFIAYIIILINLLKPNTLYLLLQILFAAVFSRLLSYLSSYTPPSSSFQTSLSPCSHLALYPSPPLLCSLAFAETHSLLLFDYFDIFPNIGGPPYVFPMLLVWWWHMFPWDCIVPSVYTLPL